jgi:hypothetical protein
MDLLWILGKYKPEALTEQVRAAQYQRITERAASKRKAAEYLTLVYAAAGILSGDPLLAGIGVGSYLGIKGLGKLEDRADKKSGLEQKLE